MHFISIAKKINLQKGEIVRIQTLRAEQLERTEFFEMWGLAGPHFEKNGV